MNLDLRVVSRHLGLLMFVISAFILAIALFAVVDRLTGVSANGADLTALLVTALLGAILAVALLMGGRKTVDLIGQREALLLVALSWLLGAAHGSPGHRRGATQPVVVAGIDSLAGRARDCGSLRRGFAHAGGRGTARLSDRSPRAYPGRGQAENPGYRPGVVVHLSGAHRSRDLSVETVRDGLVQRGLSHFCHPGDRWV